MAGADPQMDLYVNNVLVIDDATLVTGFGPAELSLEVDNQDFITPLGLQ